ncbi:hydroxyacid dehydrogenase [Muricoccus pecuniae]|uniref:D-3-phosphoglycerate dehydrogenase n=1 Tax=Muricoccus pecuniae TaxID=693023 RepID=A0A840XZJ1_9PROT|nr:hydroxyacid dehydrogenase [Roseomonas pecuniae]MBB5692720.1 D-3-phosphoglycerate dehydrogenase [Roseomonas pecuniae]
MAIRHVCRFNLPINPVFDERLRAEPEIWLEVGDLGGPESALAEMVGRAHVFHVSPARNELPRRWFVTDEFLRDFPNLLVISSNGAGHDTIDAAACTRAGVAVVNQIGANALSVAEMAIGLMLAVARKIALSDRRLRTERGFPREALMGHEVSGSTLGIVGLGQTGRLVARMAQGFGMRVLAVDPFLPQATIAERGAEAVEMATLLAQSDIVSLHCPLDATTRGMFGAEAFAAMKPGALFVTTARGGIHDEAALAGALASGHLGGAGLDVWEPEPPPLDSPLLRMDNVVATFHTAGVSHEARRNVAAWGAEQIIGLLRGETPPRLVNPEVWPEVRRRLLALAEG